MTHVIHEKKEKVHAVHEKREKHSLGILYTSFNECLLRASSVSDTMQATGDQIGIQ